MANIMYLANRPTAMARARISGGQGDSGRSIMACRLNMAASQQTINGLSVVISTPEAKNSGVVLTMKRASSAAKGRRISPATPQ